MMMGKVTEVDGEKCAQALSSSTGSHSRVASG